MHRSYHGLRCASRDVHWADQLISSPSIRRHKQKVVAVIEQCRLGYVFLRVQCWPLAWGLPLDVKRQSQHRVVALTREPHLHSLGTARRSRLQHSIPGPCSTQTHTSSAAITGRWSDERMESTLSYASSVIPPADCCVQSHQCVSPSQAKRTHNGTKHTDRNRILSVHAGMRRFLEVSYVSLLALNLYVGAKFKGPSLKPWNTRPLRLSMESWSLLSSTSCIRDASNVSIITRVPLIR